MSISGAPVFYAMMQSALQRAYPSGLPSNQVLTQFAMPFDTATLPDDVRLSRVQQGYPWGWCETVAEAGPGTYSLTEPLANCWLLRLDAFKPSGAGVSLSAAIGAGAQQAIQRIDPAQTLVYADDLFTWSPAHPLGRVGTAPWGPLTQSYLGMGALWPLESQGALSGVDWNDDTAVWMGPQSGSSSSAPIGEWLLRKWVWLAATDNYTFYFAADGIGNLFLDGTELLAGVSYASPQSVTTQMTAGWHLLSISCINQGSYPNATAVVLSVQDSSGTVVENGSYHAQLGCTWQTSGFINPTWQSVTTEDDMRHAWYVIPASDITSEDITLQVVTSGSPTIRGIEWYSVAPWRWDLGGQYDATASPQTPAQVAPIQTVEVVG
ncbi:hypothetical protein [Alicyclobacillus sp. ALC3]|uniref:hypothetical protein n=1 Tax=Alicyclobacillus sp. ALC3 TaxID=2796143 RepID=UPI0023793515|nr:hypothetical protein [Alicyclobacillus sp. ALC3]WDL96952.1 hypothetical protein JC200_22180 [Alicyclobacillus sp. ALC3]